MQRAWILVCLFLPTLSAQTATLRGQVMDDTGAVVPGALVTATASSGTRRSARTDNVGNYALPGLAPGSYSVMATAPELSTEKPVALSLRPGAQTLDLRLKVVGTEQQLTVRENVGPTVSMDSSSNASALVLRGEDLDALSDDPDDLQADLQALAGPSAGPNAGAIFVDGFSGGEIPPKESIREIRVNQNPFSPEYDKLGYGRIEILTKPGSDKYHGNLAYNFADDFWNSRNPYSIRKAPLLLHEFEPSVSGPLGKRASFNFDFQRNAVDNGSIVNAVSLDPASLAVRPLFQIYTTPQRFLRMSPRVDYALSEKHTLSFRYSYTSADIDGAGIGGFDVIDRGYYFQYNHQTVQATETSVFGTTVNETRFQYYRASDQWIARTQGPAVLVLGAFNDGGSSLGKTYDTQNSFELQNATSIVHGAHFLRFGMRLRGSIDDNTSPNNFNGAFSFAGGLAPQLDANNRPALVPIDSVERYRRTLLFQKLPAAQIRALGGGASQYTVNQGIPNVAVNQVDAAVFAGDEWRVRPNMTLSLGLRYETQTNMSDWRDFAPRAAVAWSPGKAGKGGRPKTVVRAGFGTFYDRFGLGNTLTAARYNGTVQQQFVIANPDGFPAPPSISSLASSPQIVQRVASDLRAPYILQTAVSLERQLPANTTLAVTYTNSHGLHMLRSRVLPGRIYLMESSGLCNQNQLITNVNSRVNPSLSLFGFYVWNKAMSNTDGIGTFPANPNSYAGEYGPASTDIRHRVTFGGSISLRGAIRISPFVTLQSGQPFDITAGNDLYGTTLFNARPGIATDPTRPGVVQTKYGLLDPNPLSGETILSRNYGRGPGQMSVNLRLGKAIGFGPMKEGAGKPSAPGGGGGGGMALRGQPNYRSLLGSATTGHRYNLNISMSVRNLLNHTNPGPINGNITSPLFGFANRMAGNVNGEGFSENANNRRLELQVKFTF